MSTTQDQEIAILTDKLNALENESRRILRALNWASKVRMILFFCLLLFVLVTAFMFYRLYSDIRNQRIAEVQRIINENSEQLSEPLTRQIMLLAEEQGPYVADVFREQAQADSKLYAEAFDKEREVLIQNLQTNLEHKLTESYTAILDQQETMLQEEFPVLRDPEHLANIRDNMEKVYDKIGQRYYVDYLKDELESIAEKLDTFPPSPPRQDNIPLGEQVASEFLELVRLMLVNSDNYVIPVEETVEVTASLKTSEEAKPAPSTTNPLKTSTDEEAEKKSTDKDDQKAADSDDLKSDSSSSGAAGEKDDDDAKTDDKSGSKTAGEGTQDETGNNEESDADKSDADPSETDKSGVDESDKDKSDG